jgi:hypothetical protein
MEKAHPSADAKAWETESLHAAASGQLKTLAKLLSDAAELTSEKLSVVVTSEFGGSRPQETLREVYRHQDTVVKRAADLSQPGPLLEIDAVSFFESFMSPHEGGEEVRVDLKEFRIEQQPGGREFTTTVLFQSSDRSTQQNALWTCHWSAESPPRLMSIAVSDFEHVASGIQFADVTAAVCGGVKSFQEQMTIGADHWKGCLQKFYLIDSTGHQGVAVGDANGDGLDDIYVAQPGGLPNRLYVQNRNDGTLRDVSAEARVDWMELTHGVLFVDLDNDRDQDLVLAQSHRLLIMENQGRLRFRSRFSGGGAASYFSVAAADYDADGDLDLYACGYSPHNKEKHAEGPRSHVPLPYHDSRNGGPNLFLRNESGFRFSDATVAAGLDQNNDRHSFAASWEDYDNDGDPDLYVANDFGRNNLYRNLGAGADGQVRFDDVARAAGVEDMAAGMGVTWGDYNRDGWMDLYVSNMFSAAGNRVTYQRQFRKDAPQELLAGLRRHARGNSLFQNNGDGTFADVSVEAGVTMGRWAWGAQFADLNNDGWEDIYVANGYISADPDDDL